MDRMQRIPARRVAIEARQGAGGGGGGGGGTSSSSSRSTSGGSGATTSSSGTRTATGTRTGAPTSTSGASSSTGSGSPTATTSASGAESTSDSSGSDSGPGLGGSANGILTDPSTYKNVSRIVLNHNGGAGQLIYTMPITMEGQTVNIQLDTGTSDVWLASTNCRSDSCKASASYSIALFDTDGTTDQKIPFEIDYVQGSAAGTIRTGNLAIDGTNMTLPRQAFGSALTVQNEPFDSGNFTGIGGFGPPAGSVLQGILYNNSGNANPENDVTDASSTGSMIAGMWSGRPLGARYMSVGLQRLPSEGGVGDSVLTISQLDPAYASSRSELSFMNAVGPDPSVPTHWTTYLTQMMIEVGSTQYQVPLSSSLFNAEYPLITFSTGAPVALAPADVLNFIYGAYGYQPGSDGGYYVPCDVMMNITLSIGPNSVQIPIHPLDASIPQINGDPKYCFGGLQSIDGLNGAVDGTAKLQADFVLGAPFMRSIYSVFSCDDLTRAPTPDDPDTCSPQIGIKPTVTNLTEAQQQFYRVRVLRQSLGSDPVDLTAKSQSGLSPGLKALIGVLSTVAGIAIIMIASIFFFKRQRQKQQEAALQSGLEKADTSRTASMDGDATWTEAQLQKAREVHRIHGVFDEDVLPEGGAAAGAQPDFGANSNISGGQYNSVELQSGSSPYYDARRIKAAYLKRHPSFELKSREEQQQILSTMSHDEQQQYTNMIESRIEEEDDDADRATTHKSSPSDATTAALPAASSKVNLLASEEDQSAEEQQQQQKKQSPRQVPADAFYDARSPASSSQPLLSPPKASAPLDAPYRDEPATVPAPIPASAPAPEPAPAPVAKTPSPPRAQPPPQPVFQPPRFAPPPQPQFQQPQMQPGRFESPQPQFRPTRQMPPPAPIFLHPTADVRMKPHFHHGPSPAASAQHSTDDFFDGSDDGPDSVPLRDMNSSFGHAR